MDTPGGQLNPSPHTPCERRRDPSSRCHASSTPTYCARRWPGTPAAAHMRMMLRANAVSVGHPSERIPRYTGLCITGRRERSVLRAAPRLHPSPRRPGNTMNHDPDDTSLARLAMMHPYVVASTTLSKADVAPAAARKTVERSSGRWRWVAGMVMVWRGRRLRRAHASAPSPVPAVPRSDAGR
jgi:hypothetical protein